MSGKISVSIIIPSRGRPYLIPGLINALRYLTHPAFEVILVGEHKEVTSYDLQEDLRNSIHYFPCFEANISAARNIGLRAARSEVVAFIDDDSVPEPDWLCRLTDPFVDPKVGVAGGPVRDRDGVRFQFEGARFNRVADEEPLDLESAARAVAETGLIFAPDRQRPVGVMGTNCAFRRKAVAALGGFDESYIYYLDETDMVLRMNEAGWSTAWAPDAEVHHHSDQNGMRGRHREPRDPYQLGASKAYFCKCHAPGGECDAAVERFNKRRQRDFDQHISVGRITGADRAFMEQRLKAGLAEGAEREPRLPLYATESERLIMPFAERLPNSRLSLALVSGWGLPSGIRTDYLARALVARGHRVSLISFGSGNHPLRVAQMDGLWEHTGGTWTLTKGGRLGAILDIYRGRRAMAEIDRILPRRRFDAVIRPRSWSRMLGAAPAQPLNCRDDRLRLAVELVDTERSDGNALLERVEIEVAAALDQEPFDPGRAPWTGTSVSTPPPSATVSPG
ncbi:MAG: glycosyltransferase family 2 protein [Pseudomonadota bacterium]